MDIERLKELKKQIRGSHDGINGDDLNLLYDLLPLVDEALASQSVTSEDRWKELREDFMHNLRGCDTVTVSLNGVGSTDYSTEDIHNMIASLTDNQVVAKSATSEEVVEAIEWVTEELNDSIRYQHNYKAGCLDTIITALQAYQPTTRKDRTVEEAAISKTETTSCEWCAWCKNDECYMFGKDFNCAAIPCEDCKYSIKFDNFCRHCGRKLK